MPGFWSSEATPKTILQELGFDRDFQFDQVLGVQITRELLTPLTVDVRVRTPNGASIQTYRLGAKTNTWVQITNPK